MDTNPDLSVACKERNFGVIDAHFQKGHWISIDTKNGKVIGSGSSQGPLQKKTIEYLHLNPDLLPKDITWHMSGYEKLEADVEDRSFVMY